MRLYLAVPLVLAAGCSATTPTAKTTSGSDASASSTPAGPPSEDASAATTPGPGSAENPQPASPPEVPPTITSVWLDLYNNCPTAMDYCVDDGNALYTQLSSNATITHSVRPGAKIRYRKGNSCTDTVFIVTDASEKQKASLCK